MSTSTFLQSLQGEILSLVFAREIQPATTREEPSESEEPLDFLESQNNPNLQTTKKKSDRRDVGVLADVSERRNPGRASTDQPESACGDSQDLGASRHSPAKRSTPAGIPSQAVAVWSTPCEAERGGGGGGRDGKPDFEIPQKNAARHLTCGKLTCKIEPVRGNDARTWEAVLSQTTGFRIGLTAGEVRREDQDSAEVTLPIDDYELIFGKEERTES